MLIVLISEKNLFSESVPRDSCVEGWLVGLYLKLNAVDAQLNPLGLDGFSCGMLARMAAIWCTNTVKI